MELYSSVCPLCGGGKIRTSLAIAHDMATEGTPLPISECLGCGLAWQFPRVRTPAESVTLQSRAYQHQKKGSYYDPDTRRATVQMELSFLQALFDRPARLLDIGAGDGAFIAQAADLGWNCTGVDPAARLDPALRTSGSRFELIRGTLKNLDAGQSFDAITMWDVIEHLDDPEEVLVAAIPLLRNDGILIIETGNYQSADRVSAGPEWWGYAADHRWYWAPPTLRLLLARLGLPYVAFGTKVLRPWWHGTHSYSGPSKLRTIKKLVRSPLAAARTFSEFRTLRAGASAWKHWGGLGIVAIAASRVPLHPRTDNLELVTLTDE